MTGSRRLFSSLLAIILFLATFSLSLNGQVNVLMRHNDHGQKGANNGETKLTPANVRTRFRRLFTVPVVGDMYAQVLIVSGLNINGGTHNVGFAATGHDMVYAFDADNGSQYWSRSLGTPVPESIEGTHDIPNEVGIVGTPVIDAATNRMYVVAKTLELARPSRTLVQALTLYALDITTGLDAISPVIISATYPGTGDGSLVINGISQVRFDANKENQRPGLTLANGNVYIAFSSHGDQTPYHGWVLAYDAATLQLKASFNTTPNTGGAGIWMSGQAPVVDSNGNVYALTGNVMLVDPANDCPPPFDKQPAGIATTESTVGTYGESYLKLSPNLALLDFFKPMNAHDLDCKDNDVSSGGAMEVPGSGFIVGGGKDGRLFVINENNMGGYDLSANHVQQVFDAQSGLIFSSPVWFNNRIYLWGNNTVPKAWDWQGNGFNTTPAIQGAVSTPPNTYSGNAELAVSSNGGDPNTAIIWALAPSEDPDGGSAGGLGTLYALDANSLQVLYSSAANPSRDALGNYAKYDVPTVANGKVYVPTRSNQIVVYGLRRLFIAVPLGSPAMINQPYSFSASPTDPQAEIPVNFNFSGDMPSGMSFFFASGLLTGTPGLYPGIFDFTITSNYSDGTQVPQEYALSVCQLDPPSPNLSVNIPAFSPYVIGTLKSNASGIYSFDLVAGSLPPGMTLDGRTGMVSGTPTVVGTYYPRIRTTRSPSASVSFSSCNGGTTSDVVYQIAVSCTGAQCGQTEGYHDGLDSDNIWGWAWDKSLPSTPIQVDIYDSPFDVVPAGTPLLARVNADLPRQDLIDAGKGNGNHAFVFPVPSSLKDGQEHRIHVTFAGTTTDLTWSPRVMVAPGRFTGVHSANDCNRIDGYAVDSWQANNPVDVNIFDNGQLLATLVASYDANVVPATSGHGAHGFLYYTPDRLKDGNVHQITVTFKLFGTALSTTNRSLSCPATPAAANPSWEGWFDNATCDRVDGWGWDANRPDTPVDVAIFYEGGQLATLTANYFSQDLVNAGKGNGAHRFVYYVPDLLKDGGQHYLVAQIIGQNTNLPISSPITNGTITCAALPPPVAPPPRPIANTAAGTGTGASSGQASGTTPAVDVLFSSVSSAGLTTFVPLDPATLSQLPFGYSYPHASVYPLAFNISTTAGYAGAISLTYTVLSETDSYEFSSLRVLHWESGVWVDRTVIVDYASHRVTTQVGSLGSFVIARLIQSSAGSTLSLMGTGNSVYGQSSSLTARVAGSGYTGVPTGSVSFADNGVFLATLPLDGAAQAVLDTSVLSGGTHQLSATYSGDSLFPQSSGSFVQTVTPAPLLVSANTALRIYGDPNPAFTGSIAGIRNNDNITANFQTSATASSAVGTYAITATFSDPNNRLGNYTAAVQNGVLTVTPAALQVTANNKTRMYGDANPVLDGTITGLRNADGVQSQYTTTATAQSLVGDYPITPSLADPNGVLGNYSVTLQNGTLTVTRSNVALALPVFNPPGGTYPPGATVTITEPTSSLAAIHYTIDGSTPTVLSPLYTGPIVVNNTTFFHAMATQPEYADSAVSSAFVSTVLSLSVSPASQTLVNCASVSYSVSISPPSTTVGTLTFNVSGLPAGATASFSPLTVDNSGSSTLTVTTSTSTPPGTYTLTISAGNSSISGSKPVTLVVQDFNFSLTPASQTVTAGGGASYSLAGTIANGFAGTVSLSVTGLPAGASGTFSPVSYTGAGASTMSVSTSTSTPVGTYSLTISGTNACRVHTFPVTLVVNAPPPTGPVINSLSVTTGPVGTAVTLSGLNFGTTQGTSTVTFNGATAQATAWSAGSISVTVPRGATTGNIVVSAGGQMSNGIAFTVQDDAEHIFATNCSTCGWQTTDFTIQSSALNGYTIQSGDILYFYQWQSVGSVAGINICFPGGDVDVCTDDGRTVDQNGKPIHADTIQGTTHFRRVDLSPNAGQAISQIIFHSHGTTRAGRWDVYFSNVQIVSADGTVRSIFVTGSNPSLFATSSYGVTGRGSAVEHAHVW